MEAGCGLGMDMYAGDIHGRQRRGGFSLIETLVVLAIISILMTMLVTALTKALRMAKATAAGEAIHQGAVARMADHRERPGPIGPVTRAGARSVFRQFVDTGKGEAILTQLLFVVRNDAEFGAYWHTLINPENTAPLQFDESGGLIAVSPTGDSFTLPRLDIDAGAGSGPYPVGWDFISTVLSETSRGDLGGNVMWSDTHIEYVRYPARFPITRIVATLSHRFVELSEAP